MLKLLFNKNWNLDKYEDKIQIKFCWIAKDPNIDRKLVKFQGS